MTKPVTAKKVFKTSERVRARARRWRIDNPERYQAILRERREARGPRLIKPPKVPARKRARRPAGWTPFEYHRFKKHGVTPAQLQALLTRQGGCAVCHTPEPRGKNSWHVDHNHATGAVRGILCITCNIALGMLHDDPARCRAAADYLQLADMMS